MGASCTLPVTTDYGLPLELIRHPSGNSRGKKFSRHPSDKFQFSRRTSGFLNTPPQAAPCLQLPAPRWLCKVVTPQCPCPFTAVPPTPFPHLLPVPPPGPNDIPHERTSHTNSHSACANFIRVNYPRFDFPKSKASRIEAESSTLIQVLKRLTKGVTNCSSRQPRLQHNLRLIVRRGPHSRSWCWSSCHLGWSSWGAAEALGNGHQGAGGSG